MSFKSQEFSIENAADHIMKLPAELRKLQDGADAMRCNMIDKSLKLACEMTDTAVLRTRAHGA
jgi:hypothetical protein